MNTEKAFRLSNPDFTLSAGEAAIAWVYTGRRLSAGGKISDTFLNILDLKPDAMAHRRLFERAKKNDSMGGSIGGVYAVVTSNDGERVFAKGPKAPRFLFRLSFSSLRESRHVLDLQPEEEDRLPTKERIEALLLQWSAEDRATMADLDREKEEKKLHEDMSLSQQLDKLRQLYAETPRFRRPALLAAIINAITG